MYQISYCDLSQFDFSNPWFSGTIRTAKSPPQKNLRDTPCDFNKKMGIPEFNDSHFSDEFRPKQNDAIFRINVWESPRLFPYKYNRRDLCM